MTIDWLQPCPDCQGQGYWIGTHYVTQDMATDAGEPSMAGMPMEERVPCDRCGGGGVVEQEPQRMDELCANCGLTWGSHCGDARGSLCPGHEDRMDWDQGPGTAFWRSGIHGEVGPGTAAAKAFGTEQK